MALIAIGDVHGRLDALEELLDRLDPGPSDQLVFIGDYIDRGPDSKGVIDRLLTLEDEVSCVFLRGNHEAMMLDYLREGAWNLWRMNGGVETLDTYRVDGNVEIPEAHERFVDRTELYYETDEFFFVHAGLKPDLTIDENLRRHDEDVLLWERSHLSADELAWEKPVVCGHTPQPRPIDRPLLLCIDTGCVYASRYGQGALTAVRLPDREWIRVDCR